jgi:hypothetical protein
MERKMRMARRGPHLPLRPHQMRDKSRRKRVIPVFLKHLFSWTFCLTNRLRVYQQPLMCTSQWEFLVCKTNKTGRRYKGV